MTAALELLDELAAFLEAAGPFAWGRNDCFTFPADWIVRRRGVDPMAAYRGRYKTKIGAARLMRRQGAQSHWRRELGELGIAEVTGRPPELGDVGLVLVRTLETGAIRTRIGWAMLSRLGYAVSSRVEPLAWWRP